MRFSQTSSSQTRLQIEVLVEYPDDSRAARRQKLELTVWRRRASGLRRLELSWLGYLAPHRHLLRLIREIEMDPRSHTDGHDRNNHRCDENRPTRPQDSRASACLVCDGREHHPAHGFRLIARETILFLAVCCVAHCRTPVSHDGPFRGSEPFRGARLTGASARPPRRSRAASQLTESPSLRVHTSTESRGAAAAGGRAPDEPASAR